MSKQTKQLVVKSNKLIEAKYKLTLNEQRIILLLISLIKPEDEEFQEYVIRISDLKRLLSIKSDSLYTTTKTITENVMLRSNISKLKFLKLFSHV